MSDAVAETKTEKIENLEGAKAVSELPKGPEVDANGVKVYPTSFLPAKSHMETSRIPTAKLTGLEIEITHVVIFLILIVGLFISMWKKPNVR